MYFFLKDRKLLDLLFQSVQDVVLRMFSKINTTEKFTPGFICVLHTFGRDFKWNPHIHALISEGASGNIAPWRSIKYFNFTFLRRAFQKVLLEKLSAQLDASLKTEKQPI